MRPLAVLATLCVLGFAHRTPRTAEEIEIQRRLQSAAYYVRISSRIRPSANRNQCAPAIAQFTASRKREFAQKALTGRPELPGYDKLFNEDSYATQDTLLSCNMIPREAQVQNNSCVLTPVVTEGPYYHKEGHLIRQNIAEYQDGLMLVSYIYPH